MIDKSTMSHTASKSSVNCLKQPLHKCAVLDRKPVYDGLLSQFSQPLQAKCTLRAKDTLGQKAKCTEFENTGT